MGDGAAVGGTYTLLLALASPATIEVGALGPREVPAGHYAYTGSALGPGGFARVDRHREVARGRRDVRHWHVDALLAAPATFEGAVRSPGLDAECTVARAVDGEAVEAIEGFGATDCGCGSHLAYAPEREPLYRAAWAAHRRADEG